MTAAVASVGFAVEFAWAAGESSLVPYLVDDLGVAMSIAVLVFAVNPCVALVAQPALGKLSDYLEKVLWMGGRLPLIVGLSMVSVAGIVVLLLSEKISPGHPAVVCFVSFGILDISHDALLTPSRAFISDRAPPMLKEKYHSIFSSAQAAGRLLALTLGALPITHLGVFHGSDEAVIFRSLMAVSGCVVAAACVAAVGFGLSAVKSNRVSTTQRETQSESNLVQWRDVAPLVVLQTLGWVGFMSVCFYWTEYVGVGEELEGTGGGLKVAMTGLALQALCGCLCGGVIPKLNERVGVRKVYVAAMCLSGVSLLSAPWVTGWWSVLCLIPQGLAYPIHQTNGQLLLTSHTPPSQIGFVTSLCTAAIPASQVVTSLLASLYGGLPHHLAHGLKGLFITVGGLTLTVAAAAAVLLSPRTTYMPINVDSDEDDI